MNGFTKIKNNLIVSSLSSNQFRILCYLIARSKDGECFPSIGTMSKEINISKSTILRTLESLIEKSYITREQRTTGKGKITSNLYTINENYLTKKSKEEILHEPQEKQELIDYNWLEEEE